MMVSPPATSIRTMARVRPCKKVVIIIDASMLVVIFRTTVIAKNL